MSQATHLKLSAEDLDVPFQKKVPENPRFYHFKRSAMEFHTADLITFTRPDGSEYVIKDRYSVRSK
jgi:hypothetical protein